MARATSPNVILSALKSKTAPEVVGHSSALLERKRFSFQCCQLQCNIYKVVTNSICNLVPKVENAEDFWQLG